MSTICSKLPRNTIAEYWNDSLAEALVELATHDGDKVLACHLTLYSPSTRETFIPSRPEFFLGNGEREHDVTRVIVLIDDIYDMYARLSEEGHIFHAPRQEENFKLSMGRFRGLDYSDPESAESLLVPLEVRLRTLETLSVWRRSELVYAEALAASLNASFTVFAVKHRFEVLDRIVREPEIRVAYLSHEITQPRQKNLNTPGVWPPIAHEINQLSPSFLEGGIALIHPTGIDELRLAGQLLADRWPLQGIDSEDGHLCYDTPDGFGAPEYRDLLAQPGLDVGDDGELEVGLRHFVAHVSDEISARDHLLVSSCDGLVLYRPFSTTGLDSSGAEDEVNTWSKRWLAYPEKADAPRLVSLNTFDDFDLRIGKLDEHEIGDVISQLRPALSMKGWPKNRIMQVIQNLDLDDPMESVSSTMLDEISGADTLSDELEEAAGIVLFQKFLDWFAYVQMVGSRPGAALIAAETSDELKTPTTVSQIAKILSGERDAAQVTATTIASYLETRSHTESLGFLRSIVQKPDSNLI